MIGRHKGLLCLAALGAGLLTAGLVGRPGAPEPDENATWKGPPGTHRPIERSEPSWIEIPAIDVDARVVASALDTSGRIAAPSKETPWIASWYDRSATPGEAGSTVILGHLDGEGSGPAVFYDVGKLRPGQAIRVSRRNGSETIFRVDRVRTYDKNSLPMDQILGASNHPVLRLITCGGDYEPGSGYEKNVVVFATMISVDRPGFFS